MKKTNCKMLVAGVLVASTLACFAAPYEDLDTSVLRIDGVEVTATAAELNIMDGVTVTAVQINTVTSLTDSVWAEPTFVTDGVTSGSLYSTSTVTIVNLDGDTMTGNTLIHVWNDAAATAMTFPDGVEVEVVGAEENYWVAVTNDGTVQVVIQDAAITTNTVNVAVGPRVVESTITLLP